MKIDDLMSTARDTMTARRVYAEPVTDNGVTVIAGAAIWGGGGGGGGSDQHGQHGEGGGFGLHARPVGAYVIKDGTVTWVPAVDATRIVGVLGAVAITYLLRRSRMARHSNAVTSRGRR